MNLFKKSFKNWIIIKKRLHFLSNRPKGYKEGEVWWASLGCNIGYEEDGKNTFFTRPVLILKKFNQELFLAIPLSTTKRRGKYYFPFELNHKVSVALLSQLRVLDTSRLINGRARAKIGKVENKLFLEIKNKIYEIIN